ncbi:MAG: hypothetical protein NT154_39860, partial [Verrucomicrobia bacterium]|nr:hypothetical protein [Verrucomicrobiota bacterium]
TCSRCIDATQVTSVRRGGRRQIAGENLSKGWTVSPVGRLFPHTDEDAIHAATAKQSVRLGAIPTEEDRTYDLTVENDLVLPDDETADRVRVAWLIRHVTTAAANLEQAHLPGKDESLATFKADLEREMHHED